MKNKTQKTDKTRRQEFGEQAKGSWRMFTVQEMNLIRQDRKMTQQQFADVIGISLDCIKSWTRKKNNPSFVGSRTMAGLHNLLGEEYSKRVKEFIDWRVNEFKSRLERRYGIKQ